MAFPNISQWLSVYRMRVVSHDIQSAVHYARVLAYQQGESYGLSPLPGQTQWSNGMQLFKANGQTPPKVMQMWQWTAYHLTVRWKGMQGTQRVLFAPQPSHAMSSGHFLITVGKLKTNIVLNRLGRLIEEKAHD